MGRAGVWTEAGVGGPGVGGASVWTEAGVGGPGVGRACVDGGWSRRPRRGRGRRVDAVCSLCIRVGFPLLCVCALISPSFKVSSPTGLGPTPVTSF